MKYHKILTAVSILVALTLLIRLIGYNGFWIDELYTLHSIRLGWMEMALERLHRGHFPGYFALARLWFTAWPEQSFEVALRSMSVFFYVLAVASFWPLAKQALPAPASLVALALFACNEIALRQAVEARMYTVTLFIAVWIIRCWYELQQPDAAKGWAIAMPILSVSGFMVSPTVGILLASMLIISYVSRVRHRRVFFIVATSLVLGMAVFIPGAIFHLENGQRVGIVATKPAVFLAHLVALMPGVQVWDGYYKTDWRLIALFVAGAGILGLSLWMLWRKRAELSRPLKQMAAMSALPLGLLTLSYPLVEIFSLPILGPPRYFLTLMPMAALLGGWALMQFSRRVVVHAVLTLFLMLSAATILTTKTEQFREQVINYLAPRYQPGHGVVVTAHEIADGVELYVPGLKVDEAISRWIMDRNEIRSRLEPLGDRETVWLVWYRGNDSPLIEVAEEMWGAFESNKPEDPMGKIRIYKFKQDSR